MEIDFEVLKDNCYNLDFTIKPKEIKEWCDHEDNKNETCNENTCPLKKK